jgi:hypothetical protein
VHMVGNLSSQLILFYILDLTSKDILSKRFSKLAYLDNINKDFMALLNVP